MDRAGERNTRTITERKRTKHDGGVSLHEDIVFDVLSRLPTKILCRLWCVCKGWRALISEPAFVAAHRSRAADPHLVVVFLAPRCVPEVRVMDMDGNVVKAFEITRSTPLSPQLHTRQDLICAHGDGLTWYSGLIIDPVARRAFQAFPTTDPTHCAVTGTYSTSFGRATPSGVFKVLRLHTPFLMHDDGIGGGGGHQLCEVATVMDGSGGCTAEPLTWRQKSAPPFVITDWWCEHKAIVNGVIYFIHELNIDGDIDEDDYAAPNLNCIVAFDLEREEWKAEVINGPALGPVSKGDIWSNAIVELNGTLTFVHEVIVNRYSYTSIWLLVDLNKSVWVKKYMIPMPRGQMQLAKPLGALLDGRILLLSRVWEDEETWPNNTSCPPRDIVLFYNPATKAFTDFVLMAEEFQLTLVFYSGSLLY